MSKENENENQKKYEYSIISHLEWLVVFVTLIGSVYTIYSRVDATNARFDQFMVSMQQESMRFQDSIKDFHGRLCAIEERNKGK